MSGSSSAAEVKQRAVAGALQGAASGFVGGHCSADPETPPPCVSVVVFSAPGPLAKSAWAERGEDGQLVLKKDVAGLQARGYEVQTLPVDGWATAYAKLVATLEPNSYLCHAALKDDGAPEVGGVRSKAKVVHLKPEVKGDIISRSQDHLFYPAGPGSMLIDTDESVSPEELDRRIAAVLQGFERVARVSYASSGSHICTEEGQELRGASGLHTAILVKDASDIPRAGKALHVRLALAGDCRAFITAAGILLPRTIVDVQMFNPAQPEFASGCYLDNERSVAPLVQRRPPPVVHEGEPLDTRALIPPITAEEKERYGALKARLKKEHAREIDERRGECRGRITRKLVEKGVSEERAARVARGVLEFQLVVPSTIQANDGTEVPVSDILADPHEFSDRGWAFRDPLEPEYGPGKAKVFGEEDGSAIVQSFAHGGRKFRLGIDEATAIERLKADPRTDKVDLWFNELRVHFVGAEAGIESVLDYLRTATKTSIKALRNQETAWQRRAGGDSAKRVLDAEDLEVAEKVRDEFGGDRNITYADDLEFHVYDGRRWTKKERHHLEAVAQRVAADRREERAIAARARGAKPPVYQQSVSGVATSGTTALQRTQTRGDNFTAGERPPLMNFQNGTLDLRTMRLRRHDPRDRLTYVAPLEFDPAALSPAWLEVMELIWPGMPEVHRHLEEVLGYAIQTERFTKIIVVAWGGGYNGKSPLFYALTRAILGDDAVGPMSLDLLQDDKFATADPVGKLILVEDDLKVGAGWPDGALKKLSEPSLLRAEAKRKQAFSFINTAVPFVLGNSVARVRDGSLATAERVQAFRFEHSFPPFGGTAPYDKATAERLFGAILGPELPGVLNRLIAGFHRVKGREGRGGFDVPKECIAWRKEYLRQGNQLLQFVAERTVAGGSEEAARLYEGYQRWCGDTHRAADLSLGRNSFYERLREAGHVVREGHQSVLTVYGLTLKSEFEEVQEEARNETRQSRHGAEGEMQAGSGQVTAASVGREELLADPAFS